MKYFPAAVCLVLMAGCTTTHDSEQKIIRTATVSRVPVENIESVRELLSKWNGPSSGRSGFYLREIEEEPFLFHYAESTRPNPDSDLMAELEALVLPLTVAADNDRVFEPMECVFYEPGAADKTPEADIVRIAIVTGLRPEKEKDYRLLHDNPWPDVIAAIRRANLRHFSIFLEEIGGNLYLFGWLEYVGSDQEADSATNKKDPASIRWWKETDACQIAPADANGGMWGSLEELAFFGD